MIKDIPLNTTKNEHSCTIVQEQELLYILRCPWIVNVQLIEVQLSTTIFITQKHWGQKLQLRKFE